MSIKSSFDATDLTHITNTKIQERNQRTVAPQQSHASVTAKPTLARPTSTRSKNELHEIRDLFMGLLLGTDTQSTDRPGEAIETQEKSQQPQREIAQGTPVKSKPQTESGQDATSEETFSFQFANTMTGSVEVSATKHSGRCSIKLKIERELDTREKHLLEKVMTAKLAQVLDYTVEVKID